MADGSSSDDCKVPEPWRAKVAGTLINPDSLLATDYMNHFNEVMMLIEMLPDMPDMLPDCVAWHTKSYPQHFLDSNLDYGPLAAEAYKHVPMGIKAPFELTVAQLNAVIALTIKRAAAAIANNEPNQTRFAVDAGVTTMRRLSDALGGVINGSQQTIDQEHIDAMMAGSGLDTSLVATSSGSSQADIDSLFD